MKFNWKALTCVVLCLVMVMSLCACGSKAGNKENQAGSDQAVTVTGPITIEFWHTRSGDHGKLARPPDQRYRHAGSRGLHR